MKIQLNIVQFSELTKEAKKIAKDNVLNFLHDILSMHVEEIKESKKAFIIAYNNGSLTSLNKDDCPLTGVCYDYDFMQIDLNGDSVLSEVNKVFMSLKKSAKHDVFSDDYVSDLCNANDILFLENGTELKTIEKVLKGLI